MLAVRDDPFRSLSLNGELYISMGDLINPLENFSSTFGFKPSATLIICYQTQIVTYAENKLTTDLILMKSYYTS